MPPKRFWNSLTKATFKKYKLEDAVSPLAFIGKAVIATKGGPEGPEEKIVIEAVLGSRAFEKYLELNGSHVCHAFSFFSQLMDGRLPTKEEMDEFELASQVTKIKEIKDGTPKGKQEQVDGRPSDTNKPTVSE